MDEPIELPHSITMYQVQEDLELTPGQVIPIIDTSTGETIAHALVVECEDGEIHMITSPAADVPD